MGPCASDVRELEALLLRANGGERQAFEALLHRVSGRLVTMTRMMLRNYPRLRRWEETDDVFQNAMLRLHQSVGAVKPDSVRALFGLAATQIRRTLIDLGRHHFGPLGHGANYQSDLSAGSADGPGAVPSAPDPAAGPETLEDWARFHEAVERLPGDEREVFDLVWYGGLPQAEVAALLSVSVPTVQRRWQRARMLLYEALQGESPAVGEAY